MCQCMQWGDVVSPVREEFFVFNFILNSEVLKVTVFLEKSIFENNVYYYVWSSSFSLPAIYHI